MAVPTRTVPIIETPEQHEAALERVNALLRENNPDNDIEIESLGLMIDRYESRAFPIAPADPVALVDYRMKSLGMKPSELADRIGQPRSRVSEVLRGRRAMSKEFIREAARVLAIAPALLLQSYEMDMIARAVETGRRIGSRRKYSRRAVPIADENGNEREA